MTKAGKKTICLLLAVLLLMGLAACGEKETEEETNDIEVDETVSGETLTAGAAADNVFSLAVDMSKSLNPITTRSTLNQMVDNLVYDRLFDIDENFNVTSRILDDWYYSVSENGNGVWVLTVKEGIKMHDGSDLTANDISYSVQKIFSSGSTYYQKQMGRVYSSTYQGQVYLAGDSNNGLLPQRLAIPIIKSGTDSILENTPVGSGPYMFSEDLSCLVKFDDYENADQLPLDTIYLQQYSDPEELITAYESAVVDLVVNDPTSIYNMGYGGKNEKRVFPTTNMHFICFNSKSDFFQYEPYRNAINWIIDRNTIANDALDGAVTASALCIHPNSPLYDKAAADELAFDPARCLNELERGGCRDLDGDGMLEYALSGTKKEIEINFVVCADSAAKVLAARQIAKDMEAVGLNVHLRELTWKEYMNTLELDPEELDDEEKEQLDWIWDMYYGEIAITGDWNTLTLFTGDWEKDGTLNYGKWGMPEMEQAVRTFVGAKEEDRPMAESEMFQQMTRNSVFIPVCFENREAISHLGVIKGLMPNQYNLFTNITNWTVNLQ